MLVFNCVRLSADAILTNYKLHISYHLTVKSLCCYNYVHIPNKLCTFAAAYRVTVACMKAFLCMHFIIYTDDCYSAISYVILTFLWYTAIPISRLS